ncbi:hypothetical protein ACIQPQ_03100 [Streptomyces sp. NPDC091281]|uniref:hypothetical protein n=1 Tax=Streptomyces sp. NPDC091281 TaxID=3365985 RepID=UPI003830AD02
MAAPAPAPAPQVGDHVVFDDTEQSDLLRLTAPVHPTSGTVTRVDVEDGAARYTIQRADGSTTTVTGGALLTPQH